MPALALIAALSTPTQPVTLPLYYRYITVTVIAALSIPPQPVAQFVAQFDAQALSINRTHKAALQGLANLDATFRKQSESRRPHDATAAAVGLPTVPGIGTGATSAGFTIAAYDAPSAVSSAQQGEPAAAQADARSA